VVIKNRNYSRSIFSTNFPLEHTYIRCNFSRTDLLAANLTGEFFECDFSEAKLDRAKIKGALFKECNLREIRVKDAIIRNTSFERCDLTRIDFTGVQGLSSCRFSPHCNRIWEVKGASVIYCPEDVAYKLIAKHLVRQPTTGGVTKKEKKKKKDKNPSLPPVSHYRSPAGKTTEEPHYDGNWQCWHYAGCSSPGEGNGYGYKRNAVLECPDIKEFCRCKDV
jgi:hypothetical protein